MYRRSLKKEIVSVLVDNQANVLTRVVSMFGRRGFNIDSLTVSATNDPTLSRITIVFNATERSMQQIITQTEKLEVVKSICLLNRENALYRELLLIKVNNTDAQRTRRHQQRVFQTGQQHLPAVAGDEVEHKLGLHAIKPGHEAALQACKPGRNRIKQGGNPPSRGGR